MVDNTNKLVIPVELITNKIYIIRSEKVMLDRDLAELFDVKAIRLREQLKRNIEKFPPHFMFQLTSEEVEIMVSQNAIPSKQHVDIELIKKKLENQDRNIELVFSYLDELMEKKENPESRNPVGFKQSKK